MHTHIFVKVETNEGEAVMSSQMKIYTINSGPCRLLFNLAGCKGIRTRPQLFTIGDHSDNVLSVAIVDNRLLTSLITDVVGG